MRAHPKFQRRGFGTAILERLEARAAKLGYHTVYLETTAGQIAARKLYTQSGYNEVGRTEVGRFEVIHYEKSLGQWTQV
jgi:GNAT superfamily N-acetyltransferase